MSGIRGIAFSGGGTGGHLFPGIAVAERARERFPGARIVFFRTGRAVEDRVFEDRVFEGRGIEVMAMPVPAPGGNFLRWARYSIEASRAQRRIESVLSGGFDVLFGLGGYASLPGILAARSLGMTVVLLEQNAVAGKVNRLLAPFVDAVACPFAETGLPWGGNRVITGNPVRREVLAAARGAGERPPHPAPRTVLVVGGSQGARGLNHAVRDSLPALRDLREKIYWIHVAGDADKDAMAQAYRSHGWRAEVFGFTPCLPELMARSDLVIARAGGTTLSEIAVLGVPSVLVPYPHGDGHQRQNAESMARSGGAVVMEERSLDAEALAGVFHDLLFAPSRLREMREGVRRLARPDAADAVLDLALELRRRCPPAFESSC